MTFNACRPFYRELSSPRQESCQQGPGTVPPSLMYSSAPLAWRFAEVLTDNNHHHATMERQINPVQTQHCHNWTTTLPDNSTWGMATSNFLCARHGPCPKPESRSYTLSCLDGWQARSVLQHWQELLKLLAHCGWSEGPKSAWQSWGFASSCSWTTAGRQPRPWDA